MSTFTQLPSAEIDKACLSYEHVYGGIPKARASGEAALIASLADLVPGPWVADMTGTLIPSAQARTEEFIMPASVGTSTSPGVLGGAAVVINQANGDVNSMPCAVTSCTSASYSSTFSNTSDVGSKNIRVKFSGATMPMVNEMALTFDGVVDSCHDYAPLFMRLFAVLESVAHGWGANMVPLNPANPVGGAGIFWNPATPLQHQAWIDRVVNQVGSQVDPLSLFQHRGGVRLTLTTANVLWQACQPFVGLAPALRLNGRPGVGGRITDAITLGVYGTSNLPVAARVVVTLASVRECIKYVLRCTGDVTGYVNGFEMFSKRVEFLGPEIGLLPTPLHRRFYATESAVFCRIWALIFRVLYLRHSHTADPLGWGRDAQPIDRGNPELAAALAELLVQLQGLNPAIVLADIISTGTWRAVAAVPWLNVGDAYARWVYGYGGHRDPLDYEKCTSSEIWFNLGRDVGLGAECSFTQLFTLPVGHEAIIAANRIPAPNLLDTAGSMPADGVYGRKTYPICSGIAALMGSADAVAFTSKGTEGVSKIISSSNASELLSRMYFPAVALRSASNQASHLQSCSRMACSMAMGVVDTGNPAFDDIYSDYVAQGKVVDAQELVATHCDLVSGILSWKDPTRETEVHDYSGSIWADYNRDRFVKEVCFHPFVDTLVLGVSSVVGGLINAQPATLVNLFQGNRGSLATMPLSGNITRLDAVGFSAWMMQVAGQSVLWRRKLQYYDNDHRTTETATFDVVRGAVRHADGFLGLPRVDSVYHWYYSDGLDGIWEVVDALPASPTVSRLIYTVAGRLQALYDDTSANVIRRDYGGGVLRRLVNGVLTDYRRIMVGGGGATAYRTSTPNFAPAAFAPITANGVLDDVASLVTLPGKFLNCKSMNRSLISGLKVPARPASGFDIMLGAWRGVGSLASKLELFGLSQAVAKPPVVKKNSVAASSATSATQASTASDDISALTSATGLKTEASAAETKTEEA